MPLVPYQPDLEAWKEHFKRSESDKKVTSLKPTKKTEVEESKVEVKLVAPTEQTVQRAKALVKKRKKTF